MEPYHPSSTAPLDILELRYTDPESDPLVEPKWGNTDAQTHIPNWEYLPAEPILSHPQSSSSTASTPKASTPPTPVAHTQPHTIYPTVARQRPKQYKQPWPSKSCHICGRKTHNMPVMSCSRLQSGLCRKVVCKFCFKKYAWDTQVFRNVAEQRTWLCPHCKGHCVPKAQCMLYGRANYKRHLMLRRRRLNKNASLPANESSSARSSPSAQRSASNNSGRDTPGHSQ